MASSKPPASHIMELPATPSSVLAILPRMSNPDPDLRYMALIDLMRLLDNGVRGLLAHDVLASARAVDALLKALDDNHAEVQNLALKCLGPLATKVSPKDILPAMITKIARVKMENTLDRSVPYTALKNVVAALHSPATGPIPSDWLNDCYLAISMALIPMLVGRIVIQRPGTNPSLLDVSMLRETDSHKVIPETMDLLIEVARCFGSMLGENELIALQQSCSSLINNIHVSSVVKKKAVSVISILALHFSDESLDWYLTTLARDLQQPNLTAQKHRLLITIVSSLARTLPERIGSHINIMASLMLKPLSEQQFRRATEAAEQEGIINPEVDEVREASLITLHYLLGFRPQAMKPFTPECIELGLRWLRYTPNLAEDISDEEMEEDESEDDFADEDFSADDVTDDGEVSWKVRRCAVKVLYTIISTSANDLIDDGTLYKRIAPELVKRYWEMEESVRLEILATLSLVMQKASERSYADNVNGTDENNRRNSRKRRRQASDASMKDASNTSSPISRRADLEHLTSILVPGAVKLITKSTLSTKQAAIVLLKVIALTQPNLLAPYVEEMIKPVTNALNIENSSAIGLTKLGVSAAATGATLRIEALGLLSAVASGSAAGSMAVQENISKITSVIISASKDEYLKVSTAGIQAAEECIKMMTPPDSSSNRHSRELASLCDVIMDRANFSDADVEVRRAATRVLGILINRTSGKDGLTFISKTKRDEAANAIYRRLQNETTRLAAIHAVEDMSNTVKDEGVFSKSWVSDVALELGAKLRMADRIVKSSSLAALNTFCQNPVLTKLFSKQIIASLTTMLLPLLNSEDLLPLGPALNTLVYLAKLDVRQVMNDELQNAICNILLDTAGHPLSASAQSSLLDLIFVIGQQSASAELMNALCKDVGVGGDPVIVGKAIGTLVVASDNTNAPNTEDFKLELTNADECRRKCLALSVLGEVGYRIPSSPSVSPDLFISHFSSKYSQVRLSAAIALGNAGAHNVKKYLPLVLKSMNNAQYPQYICLYSIKEILQHSLGNAKEVTPFSKDIWKRIIAVSRTEEQKVVGAQCLGKLTIIDSRCCLPFLRRHLTDPNNSVRNLIIQTVRHIFSGSDDAFSELIKPIFVELFETMLTDESLANRRLALLTLNSAIQSKPALVIPHLREVVPLVVEESQRKAEYIREVQMGPFKHQVDDGLDVRKSAYETLYTFILRFPKAIDPILLFPRILDGIEDCADIRTFSLIMVSKLAKLYPSVVINGLDALAERFRVVIARKAKDSAVKQEVTRLLEEKKSVGRVTKELAKQFQQVSNSDQIGIGSVQCQGWRSYLGVMAQVMREDNEAAWCF